MLFDIKDRRITENAPHPSIPQRVVGKVAVRMRESCMGHVSEHDLVIRTWADTAPGMSPEDLEKALLARADKVLARVADVALMDRLDPSGLD